VSAEWEDDHRQGETSWAFPGEVCLLMGAQLVIAKRLLSTLIVKPENMARNLERSGGAVMSETVMMALAPRIGRDRAHALVLEIARDAAAHRLPFREALSVHPEVRRRLTPRRLASVLDPRNALGLSGYFVDQVVAAHRAERRRR
jgi:adenylosuccinate lyase